MKHVFEKGSNVEAPTFIVFHGTGGTEHDLIPLAKQISPQSSVLSIRGNVLENGMARYFRRLSEGVFDEEDLIFRTKEIYDFLDEASKQYDIDQTNLVAIGYSNGANIIGSLLFHYENVFSGAILHHPMVPLRGLQIPDLKSTPVFIGAGENDPMCPPQESKELEVLLGNAGASVKVHWENNGHQLTSTEVNAAAGWFQEHFVK